jgi:hypothetical protein
MTIRASQRLIAKIGYQSIGVAKDNQARNG